MDSHYQTLIKPDSSIYDLLLVKEDINDNDIDEEMNSQKEYVLAYQIVKKTVERMLVDEEGHSVRPHSANSDQVGLGLAISNNCSFKLPQLKLNEFGGELKDCVRVQ